MALSRRFRRPVEDDAVARLGAIVALLGTAAVGLTRDVGGPLLVAATAMTVVGLACLLAGGAALVAGRYF